MSYSEILNIAIGLVFTFLLFSLLCSVINEWVASVFGSRAKHLEAALKKMFDGPNAAAPGAEWTKFIEHPLITGLCQSGKKILKKDEPIKPAYIPARSFAMTILDIVAPSQAAGGIGTDLTRVLSAISGGSTNLQKSVRALADKGSKDLPELRQNIENWFNDAMDRLSSWYKRRSQVVLIVIAAVMTFVMHVDSIAIAKALYASPVLQQSLVDDAKTWLDKHKDNPDKGHLPSYSGLQAEITTLNLPVGWGGIGNAWHSLSGGRATALWLANQFFGLFITAAAVSLGAPFWFDTLNRFMQFRSSVKPLDKPKP